MPKKRKLNSRNPKYLPKDKKEGPKIKERKLICDVPVRDSNGELVEGKSIPVYGVWYEDDEKTTT